MPLEEEMRREMYQLESDIYMIEEEIKKLNTKITNLINIKKKKEYDLRILKETFGETEREETQTTLTGTIIERNMERRVA